MPAASEALICEVFRISSMHSSKLLGPNRPALEFEENNTKNKSIKRMAIAEKELSGGFLFLLGSPPIFDIQQNIFLSRLPTKSLSSKNSLSGLFF